VVRRMLVGGPASKVMPVTIGGRSPFLEIQPMLLGWIKLSIIDAMQAKPCLPPSYIGSGCGLSEARGRGHPPVPIPTPSALSSELVVPFSLFWTPVLPMSIHIPHGDARYSPRFNTPRHEEPVSTFSHAKRVMRHTPGTFLRHITPSSCITVTPSSPVPASPMLRGIPQTIILPNEMGHVT
jgi:hypothetical protein